VDSQSVKTTGMGGEQRGHDGAKKVNGRKRHLLVDTQGLVRKLKVHSANVTDRDGIKLLLEPARSGLPRALFWCLVLPKTHHRGFSLYFSYSLSTRLGE
jgi:hypothetical protein